MEIIIVIVPAVIIAVWIVYVILMACWCRLRHRQFLMLYHVGRGRTEWQCQACGQAHTSKWID